MHSFTNIEIIYVPQIKPDSRKYPTNVFCVFEEYSEAQNCPNTCAPMIQDDPNFS